MKIFVDPACNIEYSSYYIFGLYSSFGKNNVKFAGDFFADFAHHNPQFPFVIANNNKYHKVIIDFGDSPFINPVAYSWCDVYGKVNLEIDYSDPEDKILAIGPGFGINIFGLFSTIKHASLNYLKARKRIKDRKRFFSSYKGQYKRPSLSAYNYCAADSNYIFFISTIWKKEKATNEYRANYIKAAKNLLKDKFEGGFAPRTKNDVRGYEDLTVNSRYDAITYLKKIKRSSAVFNTPAVQDCHGWKLGEFLALGKTIITTPLKRKLPCELIDGHHFLVTTGEEEDIKDKLIKVMSDEVLRREIESNARNYFDTLLKPEAVIKRIMNKLALDTSCKL